LPYDSDIWQTASVSGVDVKTRDSIIAVYNGNKYDLIGLRKCVSFQDRKSPDHADESIGN